MQTLVSRAGALEALKRFRQCWKLFLGIHISSNVISFAILMPLYTVLTGWLVLASGNVALTDEDILFFALSPVGLMAFIIIGALFITVVVFEQAALMVAAHRAATGEHVGIVRLGQYVFGRAPALFRLALHMLARVLAHAAPFLAVAGFIYLGFLTEFDINYYLAEKPPVFWKAGAGVALCLLAMAWVLFRLFSGWVMALPLLLFERDSPAGVLKRSGKVAAPMRVPIAMTLFVWVLLNVVLLTIGGVILDLGVGGAMAISGNSLQALAYLMGAILVFWFLGSLAATFFSNCVLSLGILALFEQLFPDVDDSQLDARLAQTGNDRSWKISGVTLTAVFIVLAVGAGVVLKVTIDNFDAGDHAEIIAHRGASAEAPENTLAAIELAIEEGADWVEIDVQETREGEIVVIHDSDLMKVAGSPLKVFDSPLSALQAVDIGSWKDPKYADQRIPTLQELLVIAKGRVKVNIELKYYGNETRFEELVAEIIEQAGMQDDIVIMSLSLPGVQKMKSLRPEWKSGLLSSVALGDITRLEVDFFAVNAHFASRRFIKRAQGRARDVLVWTINDPVMMSTMMSKGVDGIITDKPGLAKQVRAERQELAVHELLLIHLASLMGGKVAEQ
jgi:glycerophosphoryl diester phosphodiesterase